MSLKNTAIFNVDIIIISITGVQKLKIAVMQLTKHRRKHNATRVNEHERMTF